MCKLSHFKCVIVYDLLESGIYIVVFYLFIFVELSWIFLYNIYDEYFL